MQNRYKNAKPISNNVKKYQRGQAAAETVLTLTLTVTLLLLMIQLALIFHVKLTLQYAAHEAARIGALNHGAPVAIPINITKIAGDAIIDIRNDTTRNSKKSKILVGTDIVGNLNRSSVWDGMVAGMMPLFGSKNPDDKKLLYYYGRAYSDLLKSSCIEYLNPTQQAFLDWGFIEFSGENRYLYQIPTDTLRYRKPLTYYDNVTKKTETDALLRGTVSNKTLAEANVLHLRINYGYRLSVPVVNVLLLEGYRAAIKVSGRTLNGFETAMLDVGKLPLKAEGAVGMQTPLHWHPFYSFGPVASKVVENSEMDFDETMSGNDLVNFAIMNTGMKAVTEFINGGFSNLLKTIGNGAFENISKEMGNGIAFCPATWLPEDWRD